MKVHCARCDREMKSRYREILYRREPELLPMRVNETPAQEVLKEQKLMQCPRCQTSVWVTVPQPTPSPTAPDIKRCMGTSRDGSRCRRVCVGDHTYCYMHGAK